MHAPAQHNSAPGANPLRSRRRGTVIMLVVSVLTLMMILGTVYVFSTRAERTSARGSGDAINDNLAQAAVNDIVRDAIYRTRAMPAYTQNYPNLVALRTAGLLPTGAPLGRPPFWSTFTTNDQAHTNGTRYLVNDVVLGPDYRLYRCLTDHTPSFTDPTTGPPPVNTTYWVLFDGSEAVSSRWYDQRDIADNANWAKFGRSVARPGVLDQPWLVRDHIFVTVGDMSVLTPSRFNPATGAFDLAYSTSPPTAAEAAAVRYTPTDGPLNLLSFSSGNVRFRYTVRIVDSSRMDNLNTGNWGATSSGTPMYDMMGAYLSSPQLNHSGIIHPTDALTPNRLQLGNGTIRGRDPSWAGTFDFKLWQDRLLGYERFGVNAGATPAVTTNDAEWFDITDELELRAFGTYGTSYSSRPAGTAATPVWYNTLVGNSVSGNARRNYYTTYSFDANVGRAVSPRFALGVNSGATNAALAYGAAGPWSWPGGAGSNRMINLSAKTANYNDVARNAIYLANALADAGYTDDECLQAAVNYAGQFGDQHANPPVILKDGGLLFVEKGSPDKVYLYDIATVVGATRPQKTYFAYYAQPFLNEVACQRPAQNGWAAPAPTYNDFAVEILNPYLGSVDLKGWRLKVNDKVWVPDLGAALYAAGANAMPTRSYGVVTTAGGAAFTIPGSAAIATQAAPDDGTGTGTLIDPTAANATVTLERPYYVDTTGTPQYLVVDRFTYNFPQMTAVVPNADAPTTYDKQRNNRMGGGFNTPTQTTTATHDWWMAACDVKYSDESVANATTSLGAGNDVDNDDATGYRYGIELTDRFADGTAAIAGSGLIRENVGDIQGYMRIGVRIEGANTMTICDILKDAATLPAGIEPSRQLQQETKARFNFIRDPRAQAVLATLASVDRASDGVDQLGSGTADSADEARIPGRININTATREVLRSVIDNFYVNSSTGVVDTATATKAVDAILAYRDRTTVGAYNFSSIPGRGIASIGELAIPLGIVDGTLTLSGSFPYVQPSADNVTLDLVHSPTYYRRLGSPTTLSATWTKLFTACTVRSDTFVLYGYMEAIQANPNYIDAANGNAPHNNGSDWYLTAANSVAAASTTYPNIRVASRRWVTVVDRSWCNVSRSSGTFTLPKIIAIRDLP